MRKTTRDPSRTGQAVDVAVEPVRSGGGRVDRLHALDDADRRGRDDREVDEVAVGAPATRGVLGAQLHRVAEHVGRPDGRGVGHRDGEDPLEDGTERRVAAAARPAAPIVQVSASARLGEGRAGADVVRGGDGAAGDVLGADGEEVGDDGVAGRRRAREVDAHLEADDVALAERRVRPREAPRARRSRRRRCRRAARSRSGTTSAARWSCRSSDRRCRGSRTSESVTVCGPVSPVQRDRAWSCP